MITTNSLKELVEGKTVAIVGNGPSVLVNELGYLIDSADLVFRFNNFYIGKFEKYSGKKNICLGYLNVVIYHSSSW